MKLKHKEVNLSGWEIPVIEKELVPVVKKIAYSAASEALKEMIEDGTAYIHFPISWDFGSNPSDGHGGQPVKDAMTLYFLCPATEFSGINEPVFEFSLRETVEELIESIVSDEEIAPDHIPAAKQVSSGLKTLAKRIDEFLPDEERSEI